MERIESFDSEKAKGKLRMRIENKNWIQNQKRKSKKDIQNRKRKMKIEIAIENGLSNLFTGKEIENGYSD